MLPAPAPLSRGVSRGAFVAYCWISYLLHSATPPAATKTKFSVTSVPLKP
jgi:hypothetical protein